MRDKLTISWGYLKRPVFILTLLVLLVFAISAPNFNNLKNIKSPFETADSLNIVSSSDLYTTIVFLPQRAFQFLAINFTTSDLLASRMVSVFIAIATLIMFFYIVRHWYTTRVAILGSILFGLSSWFLHQSRSAEPDIMYMFASTALLLCVVVLSEKKYHKFLPLLGFISAILLYIPGLWLFILIGSILARSEVKRIWQNNSNLNRIVSAGVFAITILPLIFGFIKNPSQISNSLGGPVEGALSPDFLLNNFTNIGNQLFIKGVEEPLKWLSGTPILDIFTIAMVILGAYTYIVGLHPIRAKALFFMTLLSIVLITLNGSSAMGIILPVVYLLAASGIGMLLQQWFSVFPKNPLARNFGIVWMCLALLIVSFYHVNRYFVAWPRAYTTSKVINAN